MPPKRRIMRREELERRVINLNRHIAEHPADYEAVIAELQLRSELIDRVRRDEVDDRLQRVAEIRRRIEDAEQRQRDRDGGGYAEVDSPTRSNGDALPDTI